MATPQVRTGYIYGCRGIVITALTATGAMPATPVRYGIRTAQTVGEEVTYAEGEQTQLRGGDRILAVREEEDVVIGAQLTFRDARFDARATTIMAGGTLLESGGQVVGWRAPTLAAQGTRIPFLMELFTENYLANGVLDGFVRHTYPLCFGRIPSVSYEDQAWATPEFTVRARENTALSPPLPVINKEFVAALPAELA